MSQWRHCEYGVHLLWRPQSTEFPVHIIAYTGYTYLALQLAQALAMAPRYLTRAADRIRAMGVLYPIDDPPPPYQQLSPVSPPCSLAWNYERAANRSQESLVCPPRVQIGDLRNPIHPIFSRENCHADLKPKYNALEPAARLASRFITTDSLLPFWHTLFFSNARRLERVTYSHDIYTPSYEYTDMHETLTPGQIAMTKHALILFQDSVRLALASDLPLLGEQEAREMSWSYRQRTGGSVIFVSRLTIRALEDAMRAGDLDYYTARSQKTAAILCHELAHSIVDVTRTPGHYFFPNGSSVIEDGFEWEAQIFGGVSQVSRKRDRGAHAYLYCWPSPSYTMMYVADRAKIAVRGEPPKGEPHREGRKEAFMWLPVEVAAAQFTEAFWKRVKEEGPEVLRVKFEAHGWSNISEWDPAWFTRSEEI